MRFRPRRRKKRPIVDSPMVRQQSLDDMIGSVITPDMRCDAVIRCRDGICEIIKVQCRKSQR